MIATLIGSTTPATFSDGTLVIQDILDSIMPNMIPLALTGTMYWLVKKGVKTGWLLIICIVGGILLNVPGISGNRSHTAWRRLRRAQQWYSGAETVTMRICMYRGEVVSRE